MSQSLSPRTIELVKATVPALGAHGTDITKVMYAKLFQDAHIRALFNQSNQGESGSQVKALAAAILAYARNIDNLDALVPVVERIAHKHIGYHILPEHYAYVARALIGAIAEVLGEKVNEDILTAWGEAYWFLANILIERETGIRENLESRTGGWNGWRKFRISEKRRESDVITSFILSPVDGQPVLAHRPGQYLTLRFSLADGTEIKRNYSISCAPNTLHYRISVKLEPAGQGGSRFLHQVSQIGDILEITPPAGDFFLPDEPERPIVLLSAGVGLTPMVSMVETIGTHYPDIEVHYVHGALNSRTHAMDQHVRSIAHQHGKMSVATFYSDPAPQDSAGITHDQNGLISPEWLRDNTPFSNADFFLCGPKPFLRGMVNDLGTLGIKPERIHYEIFGPNDEEIAA
ncbi:NO-inducible flavohemoprotein [Thalassospira sp.]|uniref:NO-inducible flavohemoprotein n=1 Tax=Thalassospira sp. TaxID=1912094 RepID=UPI003AA7D098